MADLVLTVGSGAADMPGPDSEPSLSVALTSLFARLQAAVPGTYDRVILELEPGVHTVQGALSATGIQAWGAAGAEVVIRGPQNAYASVDVSPAPGAPLLRLSAPARLTLDSLHLFVAPPLDAYPALIRLDDEGGCLTVDNCVVRQDPSEGEHQHVVRLRGEDTALVATGLKVFGFPRPIDARVPAGALARSPVVDLRACGFADAAIGVRFINVSHSRVRECVFDGCDQGLRLAWEPGARAGGEAAVLDTWFHDCRTGLVVDDRSERGAPQGDAPPPSRRFGCAPPRFTPVSWDPPDPDAATRQIRIERCEFRAPRASDFPEPLSKDTRYQQAIIAATHATGARIRFDPSAAPTKTGVSVLSFRENIVHLTDHGVLVKVGGYGCVLLDHNTFVANPIRAVGVEDLEPGPGRALFVTANLFLGPGLRADLGLPEGAGAPPEDPEGRYPFAGVRFPGDATASTWDRAWVAQNVFQGIEPDVTIFHIPSGQSPPPQPITAWEGVQTQADGATATWANRVIVAGPAIEPAPVLRLPRWRVTNEVVHVRFDYHLKRSAQAADPELAVAPGGARAAWLREQGVPYPRPARDAYGEDLGYQTAHGASWPVGAARVRWDYGQFPLIPFGYRDVVDIDGQQVTDFMADNFDAFYAGTSYTPMGAVESLDPADLDASFGGQLANLQTAAQAGIGYIPSLIFVAASPTVHGPTRPLGGIGIPAREQPGLHYSSEFVTYWLRRMEAYVAILAAADIDERILMWSNGDEMSNLLPLDSSYPMLGALHRALAASDPLRRGVFSSQQSISKPWARSAMTLISGAWNPGWRRVPNTVRVDAQGGLRLVEVEPSVPLQLPDWAEVRTVMGRKAHPNPDGRGFLGSLLPLHLHREEEFNADRAVNHCVLTAEEARAHFTVPDEAETKHLVAIPQLGYQYGVDEELRCVEDWAAFAEQMFDSTGSPAWATDHAMRSWRANSSLPLGLLRRDRSYAHQVVRVSREDVEVATRLATATLSRESRGRLALHNPATVRTSPAAIRARADQIEASDPDSAADLRENADKLEQEGRYEKVPKTVGAYRHDFWAGIHHADGISLYAISQLVRYPGDVGLQLQWAANSEGLRLLKGTNPAGAGLRDALVNGERAEGLYPDADAPYWLPSLTVDSPRQDTDFGHTSGRTPRQPALLWTALRRGPVTWLIITNSRTTDPMDEEERPSTVSFDWPGTVTLLTDTSAEYNPDSDPHEFDFTDRIDAVVLKLTPATPFTAVEPPPRFVPRARNEEAARASEPPRRAAAPPRRRPPGPEAPE